VHITRDLSKEPEYTLKFDREDRLTFGIALHGANNPGREHWVSLPQSVSYADRETEFKVGK
jgi:hypothetical protein